MNTQLAAELGRVRDEVADVVTDAFLVRHPDWLARYGDRARTRGLEDAGHHIDFMQAAVELEDPTTFRDYALWCRDLLGARGIGVAFIIENFGAIGDELASRVSPRAAEAMSRALRAGIEALTGDEESTRAGRQPFSPSCRLYLAASVSGRRQDALTVARQAIDQGESPLDVYVDIFQEALYEVGRRWQSTHLTIAEEHMATATTQFILSVIHEQQPRTGSHGGTAVVCGVVNEHHIVGASIIANVLDSDGWDVRLMGTNLPHDAIVSAIARYEASLVAISVTMSGCVGGARDLISEIRKSIPDPPRIIVGGAAFNRDPQLWQDVGADGYAADARSVVATALG